MTAAVTAHPPQRTPGALLAAVVASVAVLVPACASSDGGSGGSKVVQPDERRPGGMTVTSSAFGPGEEIPERFSCEGDNVPPPLRWRGAPAGTGELAVVVEDPDAPQGTFVHWIVVGIDPTTTSIGPTTLPLGARVLPGSSDNPTYIGPCPPDGDGVHRYHFEVYALPSPPPLREPSSPLEKVRAIRRAAVAGGELVGTFER